MPMVHPTKPDSTYKNEKDEVGYYLRLVNDPDAKEDRKSTRLNSSHSDRSRMPSSA